MGCLISHVLNKDYFISIFTERNYEGMHPNIYLLIVISQVFKERNGIMKRTTKLRKRLLHSHSQPTLNKLLTIEENIITSHINELFHEEAIAVAKIKEYQNLFFLDMQRGSLLPNRRLDHSIPIMVV